MSHPFLLLNLTSSVDASHCDAAQAAAQELSRCEAAAARREAAAAAEHARTDDERVKAHASLEELLRTEIKARLRSEEGLIQQLRAVALEATNGQSFAQGELREARGEWRAAQGEWREAQNDWHAAVGALRSGVDGAIAEAERRSSARAEAAVARAVERQRAVDVGHEARARAIEQGHATLERQFLATEAEAAAAAAAATEELRTHAKEEEQVNLSLASYPCAL